uniref:Ribosome biogenesis regulatory protein n=1 Tax=Chaetoceros debilis TaxID=122233 RepID=A0A7S3Q7S7_9STRA|mmetsp:Transcript_6689/g.9602  ORF Transcript_6689/g.9602 Transcript_6689/m.9602 type:complete len:466 (+) Transcript_6689:50-1447(+)
MAARGKTNNRRTKSQREAVPHDDSTEQDSNLEDLEAMLNDESDSEASLEEVRTDSSESSDDEEDVKNDDPNTVEMLDVSAEKSNENDARDSVSFGMEGEEKCNLDLKNLLSMNSHQVSFDALYMKKRNKEDSNTTIATSGMLSANEDYLLKKASEGCSQLLIGLWSLETEKTDVGPMARLPRSETVLPRELPPPPPKTESRWEKFAKERGIGTKEKRSRKVWDEAAGEWAHRTGFNKASNPNDPLSWPIMEVKRNDDPFDDPWMKARDEKKDRVDKNSMNRMKNAEHAGEVERGTTRRVMKNKKQTRDEGRHGGNLDMKNFQSQPAGIPIDIAGKQRGKELTKAALLATQRSTASMGKFDKMREGEPERKKARAGLKKRKYESSTSKDGVKTEAKKSSKILENIIAGGGKEKDRAIRRGEHARGVTGHDYDFDDGLGASKYRKKKGRAGIGKMKKVTKKTAKLAK